MEGSSPFELAKTLPPREQLLQTTVLRADYTMADMEQVWGKIIIIGKDGHERKAEMELDDAEGEPYCFGR